MSIPRKPSPSIQAPSTQQSAMLDEAGAESLLGELREFFGQGKTWWLAPILVVVALLGLLTVLASSGAAPFMYK